MIGLPAPGTDEDPEYETVFIGRRHEAKLPVLLTALRTSATDAASGCPTLRCRAGSLTATCWEPRSATSTDGLSTVSTEDRQGIADAIAASARYLITTDVDDLAFEDLAGTR